MVGLFFGLSVRRWAPSCTHKFRERVSIALPRSIIHDIYGKFSRFEKRSRVSHVARSEKAIFVGMSPTCSANQHVVNSINIVRTNIFFQIFCDFYQQRY